MALDSERFPVRPAILLVDDEPALLEAMRLGLENEFELDVAATAQEAELLMTTRHYDVVVCDHLMPGMEGLQFLVETKNRHPSTLRILLTGYMNPELISRSVAVAGLSACLMKPVRAAELAQVIRSAIRS